MPIFHYTLRPGRLLVLGPSETIGGYSELFEVVDQKWKIYRRKESRMPNMPEMPAQRAQNDSGHRREMATVDHSTVKPFLTGSATMSLLELTGS
ncbi:MAG: hypothetical protein R3C28_26275 [Pirellulaceae bacterium]